MNRDIKFGLLCILFGLTVLRNQAQVLERKFSLGIIFTPEEVHDDSIKHIGLRVNYVYPGSVGAKLKLQANDFILRFNKGRFRNVNEAINFAAMLKTVKVNGPIEMDVVRGGKVLNLATLAEPLPYESSEHVATEYSEIRSGKNLHRAIISKPLRGRSFPAVLIIQGLPCGSVEAPFDENSTYRRISTELSRKGFLVMRVEKSGVEDSEGERCQQIGFNDEVSGFKSALQHLNKRKDVDRTKIFILGHSTGGFMAPLVANEHVAGVIVYGTLSRSWFDYWVNIRKLQMKQEGLDSTTILKEVAKIRSCTSAFLHERKSLVDVFVENIDCQSCIQLFMMRSEKFWREADGVDITAQWRKFNGNVLSIWGTADNLILPEDQLTIADLVNQEHNGHGKYTELPGTDHHFRTIKDSDGRNISPEFNMSFIDMIVKWMTSQQP